ncbi:LEA type 2 family protein [Stenotrophomonas sp. HITSZ_GD]|uniref:NDR1/HIN1-like protein n=1 Tax=Stenotrophomonas sp. HITSZ_GD TaxID=3037248 RepID=UPI00240D8E33|nr:LEA type 2 family protein [Stenotrophomonas sp. HITSZ_GD]MDG2526245.1 LEA type 2 family protein [Stenotrophomonas sp. HITSZ_GD]
MRPRGWRWGAAALVTAAVLGLASCSSNVRRVSEPAVSIQQLTVRADGSWALELRLQNYSSIPMQFQTVALDVSVGGEAAGHLQQAVNYSIGPETADVVTVAMQPGSTAKMIVADVLAGGRALPYELKGTVTATPEDKRSRQFEVSGRSTLNPAPGLSGVLR